MTRLEIAVSLIGQNFIVSDNTIRNAFRAADRILEISEEEKAEVELLNTFKKSCLAIKAWNSD